MASNSSRVHALVALRPGLDPEPLGEHQPARLGHVGGDQHDLVVARRDRGACIRTSASMFEPRPESRTATRTCSAMMGRRPGGAGAPGLRPSRATVQPRGPASTRPISNTVSPASSSASRHVLRIVLGATISAMPMPQLKVRANSPGSILPCAWRKAISRGCGQASASIARVQALGQDARDILEQAAAGDVGERRDPARADQRQQRLHIDAGRREQGLDQQPVLIEQGRAGRASSPCPPRAGGPARSRSNGRPTRRGRG